MKMRQLASNIRIAPIIFGGNVFGWTINQERSFQVLDAFVGAGFNCIDTADMYSTWVPGNKGGESETIIGKWLKARDNRSQVIIATKVGHEMAPDKKGLKKDYIMRAAEDSLRRLQTDYIDLYQAHRDDAATPLEESLSAFDSLIKQGKVRAIGASNYEADRLSAALKTSKDHGLNAYQTLQPNYNLYDRQHFESGLEKVCLDHKIAVIPYYSLASGFLSGKYRSEADVSKSPRGGGIKQKYLNERGYRILAALDDVAAATQSTPTQVALAWLLQRPAITAPIVSATNVTQLEDLIKAPEIQLSDDHVRKLDTASAY